MHVSVQNHLQNPKKNLVQCVYTPGTCECPLFWGEFEPSKRRPKLHSKQGAPFGFQVYTVFQHGVRMRVCASKNYFGHILAPPTVDFLLINLAQKVRTTPPKNCVETLELTMLMLFLSGGIYLWKGCYLQVIACCYFFGGKGTAFKKTCGHISLGTCNRMEPE